MSVREVPTSMPLFYERPRQLSAEVHGNLSLSASSNYAFAAKTNAVPLVGAEMAEACKHYPILFADAEIPQPIALLGLRSGENLFVDDSGQWEEGAYIPAYVRRYPFVFMESADKTQFILCVDEASPRLVKGDENPLFKDGAVTEVTSRALDFCREFQAHFAATQDFAKAVGEAGILVENRADIALANDQRYSLSGFRVVDEQLFNRLPDDVFLSWRQKGWLHLVYAHLMSISNWGGYIDRAMRRQGGAA